MKRLACVRQLLGHARQWWLPASAVVVVAIGVAGFIFSGRQGVVHEGGSTVLSQPPKQAATLPSPSQDAAGHAQQTTASDCSQNGAGKLLLVSISQQHIWACDGTQAVNESAVTTGASALTNVDDATPTGTWHIYSKQTNRHLTGCDANGCWNDPVAYWMPFDDQVGFHDASWQAFSFGSDQYKTDGSHGCVHLPSDFIAWVYSWAPVGTTVTIKV